MWEARVLPRPPDTAPSGTDFPDVLPEEEEMLDTNFDHTDSLYFVACLAVLLILAALTSKNPPPCRERELLTTFSSKWLPPAPDDARRLEIAQGAGNRLTQELLATCTREYNSKFKDAIYRIRRGEVRVCTDSASPLYSGENRAFWNRGAP
jgi:hypothetical protein